MIVGPRNTRLGNKKVSDKMVSLEKEIGTLNSSNVAIFAGRLKKKKKRPPQGDGLALKREVERLDAEENEQARRRSPEASSDSDLGKQTRRVNKNFKRNDTGAIQQSWGSMVNSEPIVESIMQESKVRPGRGPGPIDEEIMQESKPRK
jgi:hypothetical protein